VAAINAKQTARQIMQQSEIIRQLVNEGKAGIVPAMYNVSTGLVSFFEEEVILGNQLSGKAKVV
jgi:carbonic anhydrase